MRNEHEVTENEAINDSESNVVDFRNPSVPATLNQIAALKGDAVEIVEARIQVLTTIRAAAIKMTHPTDWVLYRDKKGAIVGYLDDAGCDRVRDLYGIEVFNLSRPERIVQNDQTFMYLQSGDGRCKLTQQVVEQMEGGRSSNEDFCKDLTGTQKELAVRKAARANLDGGITRELAGLRNVPATELEAVWKGTSKNVQQCRQGRGFGGGAERQGARVQDDSGLADEQKPVCGLCGKKMQLRPAGKTQKGAKYAAFWSCPDFEKHREAGEPNTNYSVPDEDWKKQLATAKGDDVGVPA